MARALLDAHRPAEAADRARQAIAADPHDPEARCTLALALRDQGAVADALTAAEGALAVAPEYEWGHRLRATLLGQLGRRKEAVEAARTAVSLAPDLPHTWVTLADLLSEFPRGRKEAQQAAERARSLAPYETLGHIALSVVAIRRQRWRDAEEHSRAALAIDPEDADALNNLGVALLNQGKKKEAVHYFASSSQLDPRDPTARNNALAAVSGGVGIILAVQVVRGLFALVDEDSPWITVLVALVLGGLFVYVVVSTIRQRRHNKRMGTHRAADPKASKELIKSLRRERRRGYRRFEPERTSPLVVVVFMLLTVPTAIAGLALVGSATVELDFALWLIGVGLLAAGGSLSMLCVWALGLRYKRWRGWL